MLDESRPSSAASSGVVLELRARPLEPTELVSVSAGRVHYRRRERVGSGLARRAMDDWTEQGSDSDFRDTNQFLDQLASVHVGGRSLSEHLHYEGASMWQFLPSYVWPEFFRAIELVKAIAPLVEQYRPVALEVETLADRHASVWEGVARAVGRRYGIGVRVMPASRPSLRRRVRAVARRLGVGRALSRLQEGAAAEVVRALAVTYSRSSGSPSGKRLLFAGVARNWGRMPTDPRRRYDEQLYPLLEDLWRAGWTDVVAVDCPYGAPREMLSSLMERVRDPVPTVSWRGFDAYRRADGSRRAARRALAVQWSGIARDADLAVALRFRDIELSGVLERVLRQAVRDVLPRCVEMRRTARRMLNRERPKTVMATYESGPYQRALLIEAGLRGIPTVGLMHGMIFDNHYDYMHSDVAPPTDRFHAFTIPDVTCVWGRYWKRSLCDAGSYPPRAVAVTGNWRYDAVSTWVAKIDREGEKLRLGVEPGRPLLVILTAGQDVLDYLARCLDALEALPTEVTPRIRLHPSDDPRPVRELLRSRGWPADTLAERATLFELLAAADASVTQLSTVIIDAVMLEQPLVIVDLSARRGWEAFTTSESNTLVTDPAGIQPAIERALLDPGLRKRMAAARPAFLADFALAGEGPAAERVAAALERLSVGRES